MDTRNVDDEELGGEVSHPKKAIDVPSKIYETYFGYFDACAHAPWNEILIDPCVLIG